MTSYTEYLPSYSYIFSIFYYYSEMADWIGPILLGCLAFVMSLCFKSLRNFIHDSQTVSTLNRINSTIQDAFLETNDHLLLEQLNNKQLWQACDQGGTKWWDGKTEPKDRWQELSKRIWENRPEFNSAKGFGTKH